jgi:hypothetical protein
MNKPVNGNKELEVRGAKVLRMAEDSDRFRVVWECLVEDGIVADWERGAANDEDLRDDARRVRRHFDILERRASSTRQKPERRAMVEVPVEPTEREKDMTAALREYLAVHAADRPIVQRFRREFLPDGRLYTDDHDISLLLEEQHVAKPGTEVQQYLDSHRGKPNDGVVRIEFSTGPPPGDDSGLPSLKEMAEWTAKEEIDQQRQMEEDWWGKGREGEEDISWYDFLDHDPTEEDVAEERERLKGYEGYFGWYLEILGEWLADKYPWENVGDAVVFLISGRPPRLAQPLSATSNMGNATYSLTFSPWISEETLLRAYRAIRETPPGDKTVRVLRFVSGHANDDGVLPSWTTLCDRWNAANPHERFEDRSALYKAYRRAVEALVPPYLPLTENAATWEKRFVPFADR